MMGPILVVICAIIAGGIIAYAYNCKVNVKNNPSPPIPHDHGRDPWTMSISDLNSWMSEEKEELAIELLDYFGCHYFIHLSDGNGGVKSLKPDVPISDQIPSITQSPYLEDARNMWMYLHPTDRVAALKAWKLKHTARGNKPIELDLFIWLLEQSDWYKRITKKKPFPPRLGRIAGF